MGACATDTFANIPPERSSMLAAAMLILRMYCLLGRSLHYDFAKHALFVVARNQAAELELTALGELPNELAVLVRQNAFPVWIIMLHVGIFFHDFRMLAIFGSRREDKLVILLAVIVKNEADLFPSTH